MFTILVQKIRKYRKWHALRTRATKSPPQEYYFAYGANVSSARFESNYMNFEMLGKAVMPDHVLRFSLATHLTGMGYASIDPEEGGEVWGVLYKLDPLSLELLDILEWVSYGYYSRVTFDVVFDEGGVEKKVRAFAYRATEPQLGLIPSKEYLGQILAAARKLGYPHHYIKKLEMEPSRPYASFSVNHAFNIADPTRPRRAYKYFARLYQLNDKVRKQLMLRLP